MRKILAGLIVALIVGIPALYFGVPWWVEQKALRELDASLQSVRRAGGTASRGAASYDLWTRTLRVSDLALQSGDAKSSLKVGRLTATGLAAAGTSQFSADHLDLADMEVAGLQLGPASPIQTYTMPRLTAEHLTGPTIFTSKAAAIAGADDVLSALSAFAALSASKVVIPGMKVTSEPAPDAADGMSATYDVTDTILDSLSNGRIASASIDRIAIQGRLPDDTAFSGDIEKIALSDVDLNPAIAALDPAQPKDDKFHSIYRQVTTGRYAVDLGVNGTIRAENFLLDEFAIRPWKLFDPAVLALAGTLNSQTAATLAPAEIAGILEKVATVYEGFKLDKFEARGFAIDMRGKVPARFGLMRVAGLDAGKIAELAIENVEITPPADEAATLGRFAFKGIDFVKLMRLLAQFAVDPSLALEQRLAFLSILEGVELRDFRGVERATGQPLQIETVDLSWGKYIGVVPSQVRAKTKFTTAIDPQGRDPNLRYLAEAGIRNVAVDIDLGAAWSNTDRTIALSPLTATFSNVVSLSAAGSLTNVPATIFSSNSMISGIAAIQVEAGPLDITLRDLGITDLIAAQLARDQGTTPEIMRSRLVEMIKTLSVTSPELDTIGTALAKLIENRDTTLNVTLTPKAHVNLLQAIEVARADPTLFLSQFKVEAKTDR